MKRLEINHRIEIYGHRAHANDQNDPFGICQTIQKMFRLKAKSNN